MKTDFSFKALQDVQLNSFSNLLKRYNPNKLFIVGNDGEESEELESTKCGDVLWGTYLNAFPAELVAEQTCNACRHFMKRFSRICFIDSTTYEKVFPFPLLDDDTIYSEPLKKVLDRLSTYPIQNVFFHYERVLGTKQNYQMIGTQQLPRHHFFLEAPAFAIKHKDQIPTLQGDLRTSHQVLLRSLEEITVDAIDQVIELIKSDLLYKGDEYLQKVISFRELKMKFDTLQASVKENFAWYHSDSSVAKIKNSVIGTLLEDLSTNKDLEASVKSFEDKVSGTNYKRSKSLITPQQKEAFKKLISDNGLEPSLKRRLANIDDIDINNVLFFQQNREVVDTTDIFAGMSTKSKIPNVSGESEIGIKDFLANVLPTATDVEVLLSSKHKSNLMSLVTAENPNSPRIVKWENNFTWSYNNNVTDAIKERVKAAGGETNAVFRVSLSWHNGTDLDLHLEGAGFAAVYYANKLSGGFHLDVDMNAGGPTSNEPVENIVSQTALKPGKYSVIIDTWSDRGASNREFEVQFEYPQGTIYDFAATYGGARQTTINFEINKEGEIIFEKALASKQYVVPMWNISSETFYPVSSIMKSPNYWENDNPTNGNLHYFFMIPALKTPEAPLGFYNEFLKPELHDFRKAFETVAPMFPVPLVERQLSGVGFSSTLRQDLIVRVTGKTKRTFKIKF